MSKPAAKFLVRKTARTNTTLNIQLLSMAPMLMSECVRPLLFFSILFFVCTQLLDVSATCMVFLPPLNTAHFRSALSDGSLRRVSVTQVFCYDSGLLFQSLSESQARPKLSRQSSSKPHGAAVSIGLVLLSLACLFIQLLLPSAL